MRIIIKPAGLAVILIGFFVALLTPFIMRGRTSNANVSPASALLDSTAAFPTTQGTKASPLLGDGWKAYNEKDTLCQFKPLDAPDLPARPAYHLDVQRVGTQPWNVGFNNGLSGGAIREGEQLRFRFWGRAPGRSKICILLQKNVAPFPHCWKQYVALEPQWKQYEFTFQSTAYAPEEALATILLGMDVGTVELAGIQLERAE